MPIARRLDLEMKVATAVDITRTASFGTELADRNSNGLAPVVDSDDELSSAAKARAVIGVGEFPVIRNLEGCGVLDA